MKFNFIKELPIISIVLLPFVYLAYVWNSLPSQVPMHWNYKGEIDDWGDKSSLLLVVFLLPFLTYFLLLVLPKIDPKNKISLMGGKLDQIKFILVSFMSILSLFIIYISKNQTVTSPNIVLVLVGVLFMSLGNYFKVIQPNYFIGIKTPWTLESPEVWKLTHLLAGKLWVSGGLLIVAGCMVLSEKYSMMFFLSITGIITIIPIGYSYFKFKEINPK